MPLFGDLEQISLPQLLKLLAEGRKSGTLTLRTKGQSVEAHVRCGWLQQAAETEEAGEAEALFAARPRSEDHEAIHRLAGEDEVATALYMEFLGVRPVTETLNLLLDRSLSTLKKAAVWPKAEFRFDGESRLPTSKLSVGVPLRVVAERISAVD
jgi:hypothetical protein